MRPSKLYGMIVKIKNKITLLTLFAKNFYINRPQYLVFHFLQNIVYILLYYSFIYKKTTLKRFLHYMQVYSLFDIALMNPETEPKEQDILVLPKI